MALSPLRGSNLYPYLVCWTRGGNNGFPLLSKEGTRFSLIDDFSPNPVSQCQAFVLSYCGRQRNHLASTAGRLSIEWPGRKG